MNEKTQAALCRHYELGQPIGWSALGGTRNHNFVLETDSGKWFARRRYPGYCDRQRLNFDTEALLFLHARGVPVVPPCETTEGDTVWKDADRVWQVFRFVDGHHLREGDAGDIVALGAALGGFHREGERFPLRYEKLALRGETDPAVMIRQAERIEAETPACAQVVQRYRKWIAAAEAALPTSTFGTLPYTLVHGDLQPANLLFRENRLVAFVDFDWCASRPRIYDLAFAVLFCCTTHETPIDGADIWSLTQPPRLDEYLAKAFLDAYEKHAPALDAVETEALCAQIVLSWCHSRVAGALKVEPPQRAAFLAREPANFDSLVPDFLKP